MRFDIVLNNLAGLAWTIKEIKMTSDGTLASIGSRVGYLQGKCTLEAPRDIVHNQIFNVVTLLTIIKSKKLLIIAEIFSGCQLSF